MQFLQADAAELPGLLKERFDLVFVDTGQDAASVRRDVEALLPLLEPGGEVAFHDYPDPGWPDMRRVVDRYAAALGWSRLAQADYLGVFQTPGPAQQQQQG